MNMNAKKNTMLAYLCLVAMLCGCGSQTNVATSSSSAPSSASSQASSVANGCEEQTASGYCLIWQDEFDALAIDASRWSFEKNCYGGGNNERQCYVDEPDNAWVDGEYLHIKAIAEAAVGPALNDDDPAYDPADTSGSGDFTSARLRSKDKGDWRYGRFEVRAKMPAGQGTWPAVWMLPTDWVFGGWALSGEIDIVEAVNLTVGGEDQIHGTLHYGGSWPDNVYSGAAYSLADGSNPADDFHVYAVEWEEGEIRWYVDDDHYATQTQEAWYSAAAPEQAAAPFNQSFHLILNLAVGGDWAAQVNDTGVDISAFPQELVVDYVRVYECTADPVTGKGCASSDGDFILNPGSVAPNGGGITPDGAVIDIFNDAVVTPFFWQFWAASGQVDFSIVPAAAAAGNVAQMAFQSTEGIGYFQLESALDLSDYSAIEFELLVLAGGDSDPELFFRADCSYPCSSGPINLTDVEVGQWQNVRFELAALAAMGLDLAQVNTPFVIGPQGSSPSDLQVQVDNVRIVP